MTSRDKRRHGNVDNIAIAGGRGSSSNGRLDCPVYGPTSSRDLVWELAAESIVGAIRRHVVAALRRPDRHLLGADAALRHVLARHVRAARPLHGREPHQHARTRLHSHRRHPAAPRDTQVESTAK